MSEKLVPVGRIVKTHGISGEVKLIPYFEPLGQYEKFETVHIKLKGGAKTEFPVQGVRYHKHFIILKLEGCENINQAERILGQEAEISVRFLPSLQEDEFYWHDLIGLSVYDEIGKYLGKIEEILPTGGTDVLIVHNEKEELLLPAIREVVLEIDIEGGRVTVRPQEWLE